MPPQSILAAAPKPLYALIPTVFHAGEPTLDIGCGSGRDTAWLAGAGYPTVGLDASAGMLREARIHHPELTFREASLPDLESVPDASASNVLCSAVLMHLPSAELLGGVTALARVLRPGGRLVVSVRTARSGSANGEQEPDGRLFTSIPAGRFALLLESAGFQVLLQTEQPDAGRPSIVWRTFAAEKSPAGAVRGLDRIQAVLAQDRKTATYKLALIRALCAIARSESHSVCWSDGSVLVPLWNVAVQGLISYWPLVGRPEHLSQIRGEAPGCSKPLAFRAPLEALIRERGAGGLGAVLRELETEPSRHFPLLKVIADTFRKGPVTFSGGGRTPLFAWAAWDAAPTPLLGRAPHPGDRLGWVRIPERVWLDLTRFEHWIADSVLLRWAALSAEMNPSLTTAYFIPLLMPPEDSGRAVREIAALVRAEPELRCVWTGRSMEPSRLHIGHAIPQDLWGAPDLWNLLPCAPELNPNKRGCLPSPALLREGSDRIMRYWSLYRESRGDRFDLQIHRALGADPTRPNWERRALTGLVEIVQRLCLTRGLPVWEPEPRRQRRLHG